MLQDDIKNNLTKIKKLIPNRNAKILNISHKACMDGSACQIVLSNCLNNVEYRKSSFFKMNELLDTVDFSRWDCVLITDISPTKYLDFLDKHENIILLDHHGSAKEQGYHSPEKLRFIEEGICGAVMTKIFCEVLFGDDLSFLNKLLYLVNDYDIWIHKDPRSKQLSTLFYYYWDTRFLMRFKKGDITFNDDELNYLEEKRVEWEKIWKELEIFELERIKGCVVIVENFLNDVCEKLLKEENYGVIFARNPKSKTMSIRVNEEMNEIDIGALMTELDVGGGHANAGGTKKIDNEEIQDFVLMMQDELYERFEILRKQ
jgi:oligoribonuclease NrnB/cAMP/cGMP phosphodiesterase (DHH superfamily)